MILVGEMKASASYVAQKEKFAAKAGIKSEVRRFNAEITEEEILSEIDKINQDSFIHGVIVQLPLPDHISVAKVLNRIDPSKDVDGFTPNNVGKLFLGEDTLVSCTPKGIMQMLRISGTDLNGKMLLLSEGPILWVNLFLYYAKQKRNCNNVPFSNQRPQS